MPVHMPKLVLLSILVAAPLYAQNRRARIEWERWEAEGTVAAYRDGALLMRLNGEPYIGMLSPASKVSITGAAEREVLRPGVVVQLSADFDTKTGATIAPVSDLTIVTPRPGERRGAFPDEVIDPTEQKAGPPPATARLRVYDAITGIKQNTLVIRKYRVELAPDAAIAVDIANPSVLSDGDTIKKIKGRRIKGTPGRIVIEELVAELAVPLAAKKKTRPVPAKRGRDSDRKDPRESKNLFDIAGEEATETKSGRAVGRKPEAKNRDTGATTPTPDK